MNPASPEGENRLDNGLRAATYVPLTDVEPVFGQVLLGALGRARIAAYLGPGSSADGSAQRLFVASDERVDARAIVAAASRAQTGDGTAGPSDDPLAGIDTDAAFDALVAGWHVDTHDAIKRAERDLRREDADWRDRLVRPPVAEPVWLDDDHYVPPAPPPLPRLAARTVLAIALLALSVVLLGFGPTLGLPGNIGIVLGVCGVLGAGALLVSRLRASRAEDDDDGSAV